MITSLLDNDLYKFTMMQAVLHNYSGSTASYKFVSRNDMVVNQEFVDILKMNIKDFCELRFNEDELSFLRKLRFIKSDFIDFLRMYKNRFEYITITDADEKGKFEIDINGPWLYTILLEVPLLAIISETYYTYYYSNKAPVNSLLTPKDYMNYCNVKFKYLSDWINENPGVKITDFGTRRRISFQNHNGIISMLKERIPKNFIGTSNVYFAKMHNLVPIGTMAHEWIQAHQQLNWKIADSQKAAFDMWSKEYRGDLGIALTDCIGVDSFIKDFDLFFSKLFDGVRHDSGDPYIWTDKMIKHYNSLKIDPKTKLFVYSDGLNFVRMQELYKRYGEEEKLNLMFGIGTYLTNDVPGVSPLNIVIKMTEMNNRPVVKISDSPGKTICKDQQYINYVKSVFGL